MLLLMHCVGVDELKGFFMTKGIKLIGATLLLLANSGCGKSEVDKCVDAYLKEFDLFCASPKGKDKPICNQLTRATEETQKRLVCLKAASGKD
jgi:hypothetical protein